MHRKGAKPFKGIFTQNPGAAGLSGLQNLSECQYGVEAPERPIPWSAGARSSTSRAAVI
jgi:hypothetical protein